MLSAAVYLACSLISFTLLSEDAYISFRYAENISGGYGPVFNQGGPTIEGYSNPLWVWLLALSHLLGADVVVAGRCFGLLFSTLCLLEIILIFKDRFKSPSTGFAASLLIATYPPFLYWGQSGLENALYFFLILIGTRFLLFELENMDRFKISPVFYLLAALTRPEGILFFMISMAIYVINDWRKGRRFLLIRYQMWIAAICAFVLFLIWRFETFGELVPNTFFAKVNNGLRWKAIHGVWFIFAWLNHTYWLPLILPIASFFKIKFSRHAEGNPALISFFWLAAGQIFFNVYSGGDIHPYDRFTLLIFLSSVIFTFGCLSILRQKGIWKSGVIVTSIVILIANLSYNFPPNHDIDPPLKSPSNFLQYNLVGLMTGRLSMEDIWSGFVGPRSDGLDLVGKELAEKSGEGVLLATDQCGKIPYHSGLETIDLFGLNDATIAGIIHGNETWDKYAVEIINRCPDEFVVFYRDGHLISKYYLENTILSEPFLDRYELQRVYKIEYVFHDSLNFMQPESGKHSFTHILLKFGPREDSFRFGKELADYEIRWLQDNQPIIDTPDKLLAIVLEFEADHERREEGSDLFVVNLN